MKTKVFWATLVLTLASFALSASFAGKGPFPQNILFKVRRSLSPVLQLRSEKRDYDLGSATRILVKSRDIDVTVERNEAPSESRLLLFLDGRFASENENPLQVSIDEFDVRIGIEESLRRRAWISSFANEIRGNRLKLIVPHSFTGVIAIESDFGNVDLSGLSLGEFTWTSVTGSLAVTESVIHVAKLESMSGSIEYSAFTPELTIGLTSGDALINLTEIEKSLGAKIDVISTSGNVTVAVPELSSLRLLLSTMTGKVKSDFKLVRSRDRVEGQSFEGQLGKGAGEARLRSVSGSVSLLKTVTRNLDP